MKINEKIDYENQDYRVLGKDKLIRIINCKSPETEVHLTVKLTHQLE